MKTLGPLAAKPLAAKKLLLILAAVSMLALPGCGTMVARGRIPPEGHYPYMGVAWNLDAIEKSDPFAGMLAIDLPFSAVVDTVLLPLDLAHMIIDEEWGTYNTTRDISLPMAGVDTLVIDNYMGRIVVAGADTDDCAIRIEIRATATPKRFKQWADSVALSQTTIDKSLHLKVDGPAEVSTSLHLTVPRRTSIVSTMFLNMIAGEIDGAIRLRHSHFYSSIQVNHTTGPLDLESSHGRIRCTDISSSDINISSEGGMVTVNFAREAPAVIDANVVTVDGDVRFEAPPAFAGRVDIRTETGRIRNRLRIVGQELGKHIVGSAGSGNGMIGIRTEDAAVSLWPFDPTRKDNTGNYMKAPLKGNP